MISLKKFLEPTAENMETLLKVLQVLLEGISQHVVEYDADSYSRFRRSIQGISESFNDFLPQSEFFVLAGAAVKSLEDYNQHATAHFGHRKAELETIIKMLSETVGSIGSASDENVARLQQIEQLVSSAKEVSDIKVIKMRLSDCLDGIRNEATRQRTQTEKTTQSLRKEIEKSRVRVAAAGSPSHDPLTGLPSREAAESALAIHCTSDSPFYVAVLMIDRLQLYNTRYGRAVGDDILRKFADYVRRTLPARDTLFRWTGPTLVAILERSCQIEGARLELKRILDKIPETDIQTATRSALLSISSRWGVFPTTPGFQLLIKKIDLFTQVHGAP